jgi:signal transduction histidine kinase
MKNLGGDPLRLREECEDNLQYVDEIVENVHRLSVDLSPPVLHDYGLSAGLRWLAENVAKNYDISVTCDTIEIDHLFLQETQIGIYRIVQEALTNVGKHAQAKNASIVTKEEGGWISFVIGDDGRGFELTAAVMGNGTDKRLGLVTMNERVRMLGGFLDVWSHAGEGTRITFSIPTKGRGIV